MKPIIYDLAFDKIKRESAADKLPWRVALGMRDARPFVIDYETLVEAMRVPPEVDLTQLAVLPYDNTWVEWDVESYMGSDHSRSPDGCGYLISGMNGEAAQRFGIPGVITIDVFPRVGKKVEFTQYSIIFDSQRDCPLYANTGVGRMIQYGRMDIFQEKEFREYLIGGETLQPWHKKLGGIITTPTTSSRIMLPSTHRPAAPCLLGVLALMATCKYSTRVVEPKGYWLNRKHRPQPHTVHTVVTIETSPRTVHQRLERALTQGIRYREHEVRGHWRTLRRGRPDEYRVMVRSHKRGDPSLGHVVHDAYVTAQMVRD